LFLLAVLGKHQGIKSTSCPLDSFTCIHIMKIITSHGYQESRKQQKRMNKMAECYLLIWEIMPVTPWALWDALAPDEIQFVHLFGYVVTQQRCITSNLLLEPRDGFASILEHRIKYIQLIA
jgi:hypothetical protein